MRAKYARQIRLGVVMAQKVIKSLDEGIMTRWAQYHTDDLTMDAYFATLNTAAMKRGYAGSQVINSRRRSHARRFR